MLTLPSILRQTAIVVGAAFSALVMVSASTGTARAETGFYRAELASPVDATVEVVRGVVWQCSGTACQGSKGTSRAAHECKRLSRKMGDIKAFWAEGAAFDDEEIATCND